MSTLPITTLADFLTTTLQKSMLPLSAGELANYAIAAGLIDSVNHGRSAAMSVFRALRPLIASGAVVVISFPNSRSPEYAWKVETVHAEDVPGAGDHSAPLIEFNGCLTADSVTLKPIASGHIDFTNLNDDATRFEYELKTPLGSDRGEPQPVDMSEWLKRNSWVADERAILEALKDPFMVDHIIPPRHPRADLYAEVCYRLSDKPQLHVDIRKALNEIGDYFSQFDRQKQLETTA